MMYEQFAVDSVWKWQTENLKKFSVNYSWEPGSFEQYILTTAVQQRVKSDRKVMWYSGVSSHSVLSSITPLTLVRNNVSQGTDWKPL